MIQRSKRLIMTFIITAALFAGCKKDELSVMEYINYVQNSSNGLRVSKAIDQYQFEIQYEPIEYLITKENKDSLDFSEVFLDAKRKEYGNMHYFVFRIKKENGSGDFIKDLSSSSVADYMAYSEYFSVKMQNDLTLFEGDKSANCVLFHTEPQNGASAQIVMVLGFEAHKETGNLTFVYDDKLLGVGPIKLTVKQNDLVDLPKLKTT